MPYKTGAGDPNAICLPSGAGRRESRKQSAKPEDSYFSSHSGSKDSKRSPWFDWTRVKCVSPPNFIGYFTIHFTRTQKTSIRELNAVRVPEKMKLHTPKDVGEAGATPAFDARCVTALHGVAPASAILRRHEEFTETVRTFSNLHYTPGGMHGERRARHTVHPCVHSPVHLEGMRNHISQRGYELHLDTGTTPDWAGATPLLPHHVQSLLDRSSPSRLLRDSVFAPVLRKRDEAGSYAAPPLSEIEVKKVRILFCTSMIATSSPSELLKEHVAMKMRSENEAKVAGEKCRKWAGATPKISGGAAQNFALGRSRPCCSHRRVRKAANDGVHQVRMRTLIMPACKREKN